MSSLAMAHLQFTQAQPPTAQNAQPQRPIPQRDPSFTPAFPSDYALSSQPSSRRPSFAGGGFGGERRPSVAGAFGGGAFGGGFTGMMSPSPVSLSRRSSMASGPRPIARAEYSGHGTPSLLSRAGSPTLPLGDQTRPRGEGFEGRELRQGEFIGSLDCGTT